MTSGLGVGEPVVLTKLEDWFFNDLEPDTVEFLRSCIGRITNIAGFDEHGHVELEFTQTELKRHVLWVDPSWVKKV